MMRILMKKVMMFILAFLMYSMDPWSMAVIRWSILVLLKTALTSVTRLRTANPTAFSVMRAPVKQMMTRMWWSMSMLGLPLMIMSMASAR